MNQTLTPERRYTDTAPVEDHHSYTVARIKADALIGKRSTDKTLAHRFSKADASENLIDHEKAWDPNKLIISQTDLRGTITYCNDIFSEMSGWSREELLGSNHNLIRHPDMPQVAFKLAWDLLKAGREFYGYVKNLRKDGSFYWVFAYITPDIDEKGEVYGYTSYRRYAPKLAVDAMTPVYKLLIKAEKEGGMEASEALLNGYLSDNGFTSYGSFIVDLQIKANASES